MANRENSKQRRIITFQPIKSSERGGLTMTKLDETIKSMQENLSNGSIIQFHSNQGKLSNMLAIVEKVNKYSAHVYGITPGYGFTVTAGFDTFDIVGTVKRMPSKQPTEDIYEVLGRN